MVVEKSQEQLVVSPADDEDASLAAKPEEEQAILEEEQAIILQIIRLATLQWVSTFVTLWLMWCGYVVSSFIVVGTKLAATAGFECFIRMQFQKHQSTYAGSDQVLALGPTPLCKNQLSSAGSDQASDQLKHAVRMSMSAVYESGVWLLYLAEVINRDADAMIPGFSHYVFGGSIADHIGQLVSLPNFFQWIQSPSGLPYLFAVAFVLGSIRQLKDFKSVIMRLRSHFDEQNTSDPAAAASWRVSRLYHMTDNAGLCILSAYFKRLWLATCHPTQAGYGGDRYHFYKSRVPQWVVQGWLSLSMLASVKKRVAVDSTVTCSSQNLFFPWLNTRLGYLPTLPILFAFGVSFLIGVKSFFGMASVYVPWRDFLLKRTNGKYVWHPTILFVWLSVHLIGIVAICRQAIAIYVANADQALNSASPSE